MEVVKVSLKNNEIKEFEKGINIILVAKSISEGLAKNCVAGKLNGKVVDLRHKIQEDSELSILTFEDEEGKKAFRHTATHILAQAVKRLYPEAKLGMGPATDEGFFYDFDIENSFTGQEILSIENEMKKIIKENLPIEKFELPKEEAVKLMEKRQEPYKIEIIKGLEEGSIITFYQQGEFIDLCAGPHLKSTGLVKAVKLISENGSSGAYWLGNEDNKMLSRIYGVAFTKNSDLTEYLKVREEALKRDHNKLGRELKLFTTSEVIGQGLPLLMPRGAKIVQLLQRFVEDEEEKKGYIITKTPFMAKSDLYKLSGHWQHYKDSMFVLGTEEENMYALRPMTCPYQFTIYNAEQHSYRDLPIRYNETSTLFRNELSGEMHGLIRLRQFTISEGHIVCTEESLEQEFKDVISLITNLLSTLGLLEDVTYRLSKWDENDKSKYIGTHETWEYSQNLMRNLLDELNIEFKEAEGEAAFYGPKVDIQFKNVYGKEDTIITVQLDFALAKRFNMIYTDKDNEKKYPIIIHRTSIGCYERTLAILIEKNNGSFPTWLSPVQVKVLTISEKYISYAEKIVNKLKETNIRVDEDFRAEKIGYKIREARNERNPYILVIGEKEEAENKISLRSRNGDEGMVDLDLLINRILEEIKNKTNNVTITVD